MNYYKLRMIVMNKTMHYLETLAEAKEKKHSIPPYLHFQRRMMLEYGVSEKMLVKAVESLASGLTVKNGEVVPDE